MQGKNCQIYQSLLSEMCTLLIKKNLLLLPH